MTYLPTYLPTLILICLLPIVGAAQSGEVYLDFEFSIASVSYHAPSDVNKWVKIKEDPQATNNPILVSGTPCDFPETRLKSRFLQSLVRL